MISEAITILKKIKNNEGPVDATLLSLSLASLRLLIKF
jgi:hypothetical protein